MGESRWFRHLRCCLLAVHIKKSAVEVSRKKGLYQSETARLCETVAELGLSLHALPLNLCTEVAEGNPFLQLARVSG